MYIGIVLVANFTEEEDIVIFTYYWFYQTVKNTKIDTWYTSIWMHIGEGFMKVITPLSEKFAV